MTAAPHVPAIHIDERTPADEARAFFERDRLYAAYALADLDPDNIDTARWWAARRGDEIVAAALLVEVLPFRPCFAMGEAEGVGIVFGAMAEGRLIVAIPPNARPAVERYYRFERTDRMVRMVVDRRSFKPRIPHKVVRLGADRIWDVIDLYGEASRSYFTGERLGREIYFGVFADGRLAAAAGTHVRSRSAGIAAVGNVLTRMAYRGQGMASAVTTAVTEAALEEHPDVVLNVREDNVAALGVYERLGYRAHGMFIEGPALRRAPWERITGMWRRS